MTVGIADMVSRKKALAKMARIETDSSEVGSTEIGSSSLAQVSQTQDSADDVDLENMDAAFNTTTDDDAIGTDTDDKEFIGGILTSGDGTSLMRYTKAFITDPAKLKPVQIHMTIKKRKGNLLERLKLNRVKFSDDEYDAINAVDDPESLYYEVDETGKKQKSSTQSTKTVEEFWQNYHTKLEDDDEVQAITPEFTNALDNFIAKSFTKWKWSSDKDHKADIKEWADKMKQRDCSKEKRTYIKHLIKGMKEERAHFTSQFTNEFMFMRPTMVKGLRYTKENNSFYACLVYQEIDKKNSAKLVDDRKELNFVVAEEEIKVEEEWVQNEYNNKVVQHVINMNQSNNWVDVPKDVEIRIAKKKAVRFRFVLSCNAVFKITHPSLYWANITQKTRPRRSAAKILVKLVIPLLKSVAG